MLSKVSIDCGADRRMECVSPNVWDIDCSSFFGPEVDGAAIHGVYFLNDGTINLMRHVLRGLGRGVLGTLGYAKGTAWPGTRWAQPNGISHPGNTPAIALPRASFGLEPARGSNGRYHLPSGIAPTNSLALSMLRP